MATSDTPTPEGDEPPGSARRARLARMVATAVALGLLSAAIWSARDVVADALVALRHADGDWIALALACQVAVYAALGAMLTRLQESRTHLRWGTCTSLALVVFGLGGIMPASPAEGMTMATIELNRRGMSSGRAAGMLVLSEWVRFLALSVLFAIDRVVAALNGRRLSIGLGAVVASSLLIIAATLAAASFVRGPRAAAAIAGVTRRLPRRSADSDDDDDADPAHQVHLTVQQLLGSRRNRLTLGIWASLGWLADAACLALCVKALGDELGIDAVLLAYVLAAAVALVPFLPGGLGAVEVVVPTVMHRFGVPFDTALAATLAWRGLSLILPAVAGSVALLGLRRRSRAGWSEAT